MGAGSAIASLAYCSPRHVGIPCQRPGRRRAAAQAPRLARASRQRPALPQQLPAALAAAADPRLQHHAARAAAGAAPAAELRRRRDARRWRSTSRSGSRTARPRRRARCAAAQWFRDQMAPYGLPVSSDTWQEHVPGLGKRASCRTCGRSSADSRSDAIVVMAHRDNTGVGPGANDNASGTAALVELARGYAQADTPAARARPPGAHARLPLDRRRRVRRARRRPLRQAAAVPRRRRRQPARDRRPRAATDRDRRRDAALAGGDARRDGGEARARADRLARATRAGFGAQLLDLAFPFTLYEQGPFVARGIPAITLTTAGERPPDAFTDRRSLLVQGRLDAMGRAAQDLVGSLDQGSSSRRARPRSSGRATGSFAAGRSQLLLIGLLVPFLVGAVDLFARCRRRGIPLAPAARSLRSRLGLLALRRARLLRVPRGRAPGPPATADRRRPTRPPPGNWPVVALIGARRRRLARLDRRAAAPRAAPAGRARRAARRRDGRAARARRRRVAYSGNKPVRADLHPARRCTRGSGCRRSAAATRRRASLVFVIGLAGPIVLLASFAVPLRARVRRAVVSRRAGRGRLRAGRRRRDRARLDRVRRTARRGLRRPLRRRTRRPSERPARGPLRELVRTIVLTTRARRRVTEERRRAVGG